MRGVQKNAGARAAPPSVPLVYTVREACTILKCSQSRLYLKMSRGEIESYKDGRSRRIPADALHEHLAALRGQAA